MNRNEIEKERPQRLQRVRDALNAANAANAEGIELLRERVLNPASHFELAAKEAANEYKLCAYLFQKANDEGSLRQLQGEFSMLRDHALAFQQSMRTHFDSLTQDNA